MDYRKIENNIIARIDRGEHIPTCIQRIAEAENIRTAFISGIGACDVMEIGCYEVSTKEYNKYIHKGDFEITSLLGNITAKDGNFYLHLHITATDEKGNAYGGHLNDAVISGTCEIHIQILDVVVERTYDDETGLNLMKFF